MIASENTMRDSNPRTALAERLWRAADLQAAEIEARLTAGPRPVADVERDARVLSVLAKTLRELSAVKLMPEDMDDHGEDATPDDIEALRNALGERLRKITASRFVEEERREIF